jgi:hypothetical protein
VKIKALQEDLLLQQLLQTLVIMEDLEVAVVELQAIILDIMKWLNWFKTLWFMAHIRMTPLELK